MSMLDWRVALNCLGAMPLYGYSAYIGADCRSLGNRYCDCVHCEYYDVYYHYESYTCTRLLNVTTFSRSFILVGKARARKDSVACGW